MCFCSNVEITLSDKIGLGICDKCNTPEQELEITESATV